MRVKRCTERLGRGRAGGAKNEVWLVLRLVVMVFKVSDCPTSTWQDSLVAKRTRTGVCTYWVHLQKPLWPRVVQVNEDFFIRQTKFFQDDLHPMTPATTMVGVHLHLGELAIALVGSCGERHVCWECGR